MATFLTACLIIGIVAYVANLVIGAVDVWMSR